jgi:FAD/FMN-containing dehydrogenase
MKSMTFYKHYFSILSLVISAFLQRALSTQEAWLQLNQSVSGRLHVGTPLALPCFSNYNGNAVSPDPTACAAIQQNYTSSVLRAGYYGGFQNIQDDICASVHGDQCLLDNTNPQNPLAYNGVTCNQGSVSPYFIEVQEPEDVVAAFSFSKKTGTRLSIKNSGHDYVGRNALQGSLAVWTHNLKTLSYDSIFVPEGCNTNTSYDSITTGAGVDFDEVYQFADMHNVTHIGAYAGTVGVSGGWIQMGGHSVLSPVYNLGIDRVVQYKVVTPDGIFRTVNECQNSDIFWALRGGGAGTFGVVLESTHRVEKQLELVVSSISFPATQSNSLPFLQILLDNATIWATQGWGGHLQSRSLINVTPLLSLSEAEESYKSVNEYALSQNGTVVMEVLTWYGFYKKYVLPNQAPVAGGVIINSRLIPTALFETPVGRARILAYCKYVEDLGLSIYIPYVNPVLFPYVEGSTSATPAWRNSLWHLATVVNWAWNSTVAEKRAVVALAMNITQALEELAPESGAYGNEANPWTENWQEAFWGENYPRLLAIKQKYDPDELLMCFKCVGFDDKAMDSRFECLAAFTP